MNSLSLNKNIEKYFSIYDTEIISKINSCFEIYSSWNEKINLINNIIYNILLNKKVLIFYK